jgi:hypothetical protein
LKVLLGKYWTHHLVIARRAFYRYTKINFIEWYASFIVLILHINLKILSFTCNLVAHILWFQRTVFILSVSRCFIFTLTRKYDFRFSRPLCVGFFKKSNYHQINIVQYIDLIRIDLTLVFLLHCGFSVTHDCTSDNGFSVVPFFNGFRIRYQNSIYKLIMWLSYNVLNNNQIISNNVPDSTPVYHHFN